jgi:4-amino-4-deoxy-L-arabinose transferase-like glycosyltransferase
MALNGIRHAASSLAAFRIIETHREALGTATKFLLSGLVATALALRLTYYLMNPSLSTDEASLALNLMHRPYDGLFDRLAFNQAAPPGFLLLQKFTIDLFEPSPLALRFLPLIAGAVAVLLMYRFVVRIANRPAALVALALFTISGPLVTYASTNKQYSIDVVVTLVVYLVALEIRDCVDIRHVVMFAVVGIIAVFLSHPAIFVLAGIWIVLVSENAIARRWPQVASLVGAAALWLASLALAYVLTRASIEQIQRSTAAGWQWSKPLAALETLGGIARYLLGIPSFVPEVRAVITCIAVALCLVGVKALSRANLGLTIALVLPWFLAGAAVFVGDYPSFPRTFLFIIPSLTVLIAVGGVDLLGSRRATIVRTLAGLSLVLLVGVGTFEMLRSLRSDTLTEPTRTLTYLAERARAGDSLYVSRSAQYILRYYLECACFGESRTVDRTKSLWPIKPASGYGQFDPALESSAPVLIAGTSGSGKEDYAEDFATLVGRRRVWVLVVDESQSGFQPLTSFLRDHGRLVDTFPKPDGDGVASVYLYDLRPNET